MVQANGAYRIDVLETLRQDGPPPLSALPDTCAVPWRSSGWNNAKNLKMLVGVMVERGAIGRCPYWSATGWSANSTRPLEPVWV